MSPNSHDESLSARPFDVVVVGAGVVGCAVARRFALAGARVLVVEKGRDVLDGASKGNSAILHTGFDAPPGSVEQACLVDGYREYCRIRSGLNLPLLACGALVLAWNETEEARLDSILETAQRNGVDDAQRLTRRQVLRREPGLSDKLVGALEIPGESIIDPWSTPHAYLLQALQHDAVLARDCEVLDGCFEGGGWHLRTSRGEIESRYLVNCAGLYGDLLERKLMGQSAFEIRPRKGQFVVFDKSASGLTRSILLPVPSEKTKGIVVCPTIFGNLLVGPTAEEQGSRSEAAVERARLEALIRRGTEVLPALSGHAVTATYAGLRPATEFKDYQVEAHRDSNYCCVGGIRSTGLSAALGIANRVFDLASGKLAPLQPPDEICWPRMPNLAEGRPRDWQQPGNGGIVCHCELVTRREIRAAMTGPLAAGSLAGLKRRTRVTMGRCQGFYCSAELSEMTAGAFDDFSAGRKS